MRLSPTTIDAAFERHGAVYHGRKGWDIPYHIECWDSATAAFQNDSSQEFGRLYTQLKNRWGALRPNPAAAWSADETFDHLRALDQRWRSRSLRELDDGDVARCYEIVESMSEIKRMKYGPSVVAISKFLHIWNLRLFVIVDDAVMWRWVFAHRWIWSQVKETRDRIQAVVGVETPIGKACDLLSYVAVLRWSADLIRANPEITARFSRHVRAHAPTNLPLETYEAVAVEWLLLGLVELPPGGVSLPTTH